MSYSDVDFRLVRDFLALTALYFVAVSVFTAIGNGGSRLTDRASLRQRASAAFMSALFCSALAFQSHDPFVICVQLIAPLMIYILWCVYLFKTRLENELLALHGIVCAVLLLCGVNLSAVNVVLLVLMCLTKVMFLSQKRAEQKIGVKS